MGNIPLVKVANTKTPDEKVAVIVANLRQRGASKPRTVETLSSTISSLFQKQLFEEELGSLLGELQAKGLLSVNGAKVTYMLPPE